MKFLTAAALLAFSATKALADGPAIVASLNNITSSTETLDNKVVTWNGGLLTALPILSASGDVISAIDDGTDVAENSAALSTDESVQVAGAVTTLSNEVNITITDIIAAKPKFEKLLLTGLIKSDLQLTKKRADSLSSAIIAKVPSSLQSTAQSIVAGIDASFQQGIDAYSS